MKNIMHIMSINTVQDAVTQQFSMAITSIICMTGISTIHMVTMSMSTCYP